MAAQKAQSEDTPCWKKSAAAAAAEGGFMANFKGHLDEFVSTPMDQHRICLKRTMQDFREFVKLKKSSFGSAKVDAEGGSGAKDVASSPPVKV